MSLSAGTDLRNATSCGKSEESKEIACRLAGAGQALMPFISETTLSLSRRLTLTLRALSVVLRTTFWRGLRTR
jgi:hypothetical protein